MHRLLQTLHKHLLLRYYIGYHLPGHGFLLDFERAQLGREYLEEADVALDEVRIEKGELLMRVAHDA